MPKWVLLSPFRQGICLKLPFWYFSRPKFKRLPGLQICQTSWKSQRSGFHLYFLTNHKFDESLKLQSLLTLWWSFLSARSPVLRFQLRPKWDLLKDICPWPGIPAQSKIGFSESRPDDDKLVQRKFPLYSTSQDLMIIKSNLGFPSEGCYSYLVKGVTFRYSLGTRVVDRTVRFVRDQLTTKWLSVTLGLSSGRSWSGANRIWWRPESANCRVGLSLIGANRIWWLYETDQIGVGQNIILIFGKQDMVTVQNWSVSLPWLCVGLIGQSSYWGRFFPEFVLAGADRRACDVAHVFRSYGLLWLWSVRIRDMFCKVSTTCGR